LCIESFHCFAKPLAVLQGAHARLAESQGTLVVADIFERTGSRDPCPPHAEQLFAAAGFAIEKKEVITINVKYAMNLDKPRIEKIVSGISENKWVKHIMRNFLASAEDSKTFTELGKVKDYIYYVLRPAHNS
jgi:hypothetical protein